MAMAQAGRPTDRVAAVRAFNRFYTNTIGVLGEGLLRTPYSLTEARIVFELAQRDETEVADLRRTLDVDPGYLSRVLARFEAEGLVGRKRSPSDRRRQVVRLTGAGRSVFRTLDGRATDDVRALLSRIPDDEQRRMIGAMAAIRGVLDTRPEPEAFVLRPPAPGDLGWIVARHGALYADEYGWDASFEALVARVVADYAEHRDPRRENAWIADVDGVPVGCVLCVRKTHRTAQLRLLLVEPGSRGMGLGRRLVEECVRFARRAAYRQLVLWTNDVLEDARRVYERAGFELTEEEPHHSFGHDLVGQTWSLRL